MQRNLYFDTLRGIAILMVVAIHTFIACEFDNFQSICAISMREIFNVAVPLFLAISGFFIVRKKIEYNSQIFKFWKKQIPKVYIPTLFWSIPYLTLALYHQQSLLKNILVFLLCGYSIYYFIALIIQCYLLLPFIQKKMLNYAMGGVILSLSLICVAVISYTSITRFPLIVFAGPVIVWLIFFWIGVFLSRRERDYKIGKIFIGVLLSFVLMRIETKYRHEATENSCFLKFTFNCFFFLSVYFQLTL